MLVASSRRAALREHTAQAHALVDTAIGPFASIEAYRSYLRGMHAFRAPYEFALAAVRWPDGFGAWRPVMIGAALDRDLVDLGLHHLSVAAAAPTRELSHDTASLLGTLYVLEGSALGARLLYKRACELGLRDDFGARHLSQQARGVDGWRGFLHVLEEASDVELEAVVTAADAAFRAAESAFGRRDVVAV